MKPPKPKCICCNERVYKGDNHIKINKILCLCKYCQRLIKAIK